MAIEYKIRLDRSFFSKQYEILRWLNGHYGASLSESPIWRIEQAFGYTDIYFLNEADSKFFDEWTKTI